MWKAAAALALFSSLTLTGTTRAGEVETSHDLLPTDQVTFGVYDPHSAFSSDRNVDIEHVFVFWQVLDTAELRRRLANAEKYRRIMMVTVEPYTRAINWRDGGDQLFADIVAGRFRPEIERVCSEFGRFKGRVLVRWGHEMEDPTGRYPWARKDAEGYKAAFRSFVDTCRKLAPNAAFVWSPKGEENLARYYPGDGYVDFVGLSLWGLEKMDRDFFGRGRTFAATFSEKYDRVSAFSKPVIIAELGVSGGKAYRERWFASLFETISSRSSKFAKLRAVVYFNDREPHYWPLGYGSPDWRISTGWFSRAKQLAKHLRTTGF